MKNRYNLTHDEWLEERKKYIGASDCAVVMGFSPWKSAIELYYEKTGEVTPEDISNKDAIKMGIKLEPVVADLFYEHNIPKYGTRSLNTYGAADPTLCINEKYPFMACSPDAMMFNSGEYEAGVELKTTSEHNKGEWEEGKVPYHYILQCQHSMAVMEVNQWYIACLIGGRTYVQQLIERDDDLIALIVEAERRFWDGVQTKTPPEWDGSASAWNVLTKAYPQSNGETIDISTCDEVNALLAKYDELAGEIKERKSALDVLQTEQDSVKQKMIAMLGSAERAVFKDRVIEYKTIERKEYVSKASSYRKFSIKQLKDGK